MAVEVVFPACTEPKGSVSSLPFIKEKESSIKFKWKSILGVESVCSYQVILIVLFPSTLDLPLILETLILINLLCL